MRIDTAKGTVTMGPEKTTKEKIGELVGEASMCWSETPTGVFESTKASEITDKLEQIVVKNKERVLEILLKETPWAVERYKAQIKHTGSLVTASMGIAYEKGLRDAIKILAKEGQI